MSNYAEIQALLNGRLREITDLPLWSRENFYIEPSEDEMYVESFLVPSISENRYLGDTPTYESGVFAVNVAGVRGRSWGYIYELVDKIIEKFKKNTRLIDSSESLTVNMKKAYPIPGFQNDTGRFVVPVHCEYFAFVDN